MFPDAKQEASTICGYGVRIGLRSTGVGSAQLKQRLFPLRVEPGIVDASVVFSLGDQDGAVGSASCWDRLVSDIHHYVAEHSTESVFVHAGVVGWKGVALLFPGRSHAGKSTLVEALVASGATYYSDEFAIIDADGSICAYPKPIGRRVYGSGGVRRQQVQISSEGHNPPGLRAGLVVTAEYRRGGRSHLRAVGWSEALLDLIDNTVAIRHRPDACLRALGAVVACSAHYRATRGEATRFVPRILELAEATVPRREFGP